MMDELFIQHKLSYLEFDIPKIGLYSTPHIPMAHVKKWSTTNDRIIYPMKIRWAYNWVGDKHNFTREISQELSKLLNIHMSMTKNPGFNYRLKTKENVVVSRLLVNSRDVNNAINLLIDEANRFYILYCHVS